MNQTATGVDRANWTTPSIHLTLLGDDDHVTSATAADGAALAAFDRLSVVI